MPRPPGVVSLTVSPWTLNVTFPLPSSWYERHGAPLLVVTAKFQVIVVPEVGKGRTKAGVNVTTSPLAYVQVFPSALKVPTSDWAGRQAVARAAVVFQQFVSLAR